jgi:hypothetical protein
MAAACAQFAPGRGEHGSLKDLMRPAHLSSGKLSS